MSIARCILTSSSYSILHVLLAQIPDFWNYRCTSPCLASRILFYISISIFLIQAQCKKRLLVHLKCKNVRNQSNYIAAYNLIKINEIFLKYFSTLKLISKTNTSVITSRTVLIKY